MKVSGTLAAPSADDSPIYLAAGGAVYEAIPGEGSFTAWLPADAADGDIQGYICE